MRSTFKIAAVIWALHHSTVSAQFGSDPQSFGYIEVRPGCHMFYWLFYALDMGEMFFRKPLLVWLQGGPGSASTGHANFMTMGPIDLNLQRRKRTWVKFFNVLYVDNPVGVGYSYVDQDHKLAHSNEHLANDLVMFLAGFYSKHPLFLSVPLYICGQSYGGKMAVDFALALDSAYKEGNKTSNLEAILLGNPWISPLDYMESWSTLLETVGLIDADGAARIHKGSLATKSLMDKGSYIAASKASNEVQKMIVAETHGINFFDIMKTFVREPVNIERNTSGVEQARRLFEYGNKHDNEMYQLNFLMNAEVKRGLQIPAHVNWVSYSDAVFAALLADFMKPVKNKIELLLNETDIHVVIYNGNNDLISGTMGQQSWIDRLAWDGAKSFRRANRSAIWVNKQLQGYYKHYKQFKFYWIIAAGHCAPADNPDGVLFMLKNMMRKEDDD